MRIFFWLLLTCGANCAPATEPTILSLPRPSSDPLEEDVSSDAVLAIEHQEQGNAAFLAMVRETVKRHPALAETRADYAAAEAGRRVARAGLFPTVEASIVADQAIARRFGNDLNTIVERSRLDGRTDVTLLASQTVFDFGAISKDINAANARIAAARAQNDDTASQVALLAITAYCDLFAYQQLTALSRSFQQRQVTTRGAVSDHIRQGTSPRGDLSRVDASIARVSGILANFERRQADAEARWVQLSGFPAPTMTTRPGRAGPILSSKDVAVAGAGATSAIVVADQLAKAARLDAKAQHARLLPQVAAQVNIGRYGILEGIKDYDARARLSVSQRFLGGVSARADQSDAQARAAEARADRVREEAERDASIAWTDLVALDAQLASQRSNYISARRVRDVEAERFRVERGTLIDLLDAEETYFNVATSYISVLSQRDVARFVLLERAGKLSSALDLDTLIDNKSEARNDR